MEEMTQEDFEQLMKQMAEAQARAKKIKLRMIPVVMFTAPIMIPLDILKTALMRKVQIQKMNAFADFMNAQIKAGKVQRCPCHECDGHCHE